MPRYHRIAGADLAHGLELAGLSLDDFCRIYGVRKRRAEDWLNDKAPIPHAVSVFLGMAEMPEALERARAVTKHLILETPDRPKADPAERTARRAARQARRARRAQQNPGLNRTPPDLPWLRRRQSA